MSEKKAIIYQNSKSPTQSGTAKTDEFILRFLTKEDTNFIESLMGWESTIDPETQLKFKFNSLEEAILYANKHNISYEIELDKPQTHKPKSYAENFKYKP